MWVRAAAVVGFLGVALGAFGAHGLRGRPPEMLDIYRTGVLYHLVHAAALLAVALAAHRIRWARAACWLFLVGVAVFSGSLYLLAVTGDRALGAVTPVGGTCLLAGWTILAAGGGPAYTQGSTEPHDKRQGDRS